MFDDCHCFGYIKILATVIKTCMYVCMYVRGSLNKFPDFFRMSTFIDSTHIPFEIISSGCNALVVLFQQLLEGPMEILLCERVNDLRHSLFHLLNCLIMTASELRVLPREQGLDYREAEELS